MKRNISRCIKAFTMAIMFTITSSVYGASGGGGGSVGTGVSDTEIWAGVFRSAEILRINVSVPTMFAFVVQPNTTAGKENESPVIIEPNSHVTAGTGSTHILGSVGSNRLQMTNSSSKKRTSSANWEGVDVSVNGTLVEEAGRPLFSYDPTLIGATGLNTKTAFTYALELRAGATGVHKFNGSKVGTGYKLDTPIELAKPTVDGTTGNITADTQTAISLDISVGGKNSDYSTSQASSKVATISWSVVPKP